MSISRHKGKLDGYIHLYLNGQSETVIYLGKDMRLKASDELKAAADTVLGRWFYTFYLMYSSDKSPSSYKERTYRNRLSSGMGVSFNVAVKETDLWVCARAGPVSRGDPRESGLRLLSPLRRRVTSAFTPNSSHLSAP